MKRAIILKYLFVRGYATPPVDYLDQAMTKWTPEERAQFSRESTQMFARDVDHLKAAGIWRSVEKNERRFLEDGIDQTNPQQRIDASWLAESIVCLLWALRTIPDLPPYDQAASHELIKMLPTTSLKELLQAAELRTQEEIKKQRDVAELWHWRARTRRLQEEGQLRGELFGGKTIEQIIAFSASKGAEEGDLPSPIGSDFPAMGKPYRDLSFEEFASLTSIAQERHKAFNWLCGLSPSGLWSDTPTDT